MAELMDFPKELVVEIMSFLPAESLVQFKCVCKLWYFIINDRGFVAKHLRNANKMSSTKSLCFSGYGKEFEGLVNSFLTMYDDEKYGELAYSVAVDSVSPFLKQHTDEYFLSSQCNGVFCLLGTRDINDVMLCNPTTREFKLLQGSCFGVKTQGVMFGFGYDPSVDSYKVVRAVLFCSGDDLSLGAEVYTLGTSSWREIKFDVTLLSSQLRSLASSMACGQNAQRYCKGACYWLLSALHYEEKMIICFNMREDQFYRISLPSNVEGEPEGMPLFRSLAIWNESVALIEFSYSDITRPINIWAMLDSCCGSRASCYWTKQLSIGPLESIFRTILFWKGDELLMGADDGYVVTYNIHDKRVGNLPITPGSLMCNTSVYVKSLVSVQGKI